MRLLNVHTLNFSVYHREVPKYAIASHRWKAGTEAGIKDVQKKRNTDIDGYRKVEDFARYVRDHISHVEWLWIDTCCVDQSSSQEVTEAVNSMFRWYAEAEVCLAYLADVGSANDEQELKRSEWFCRGWTLQELLAPHVVVFLTGNWEQIGYKGGLGWTKSGIQLSEGPALESTIATITGIPQDVLHNYDRSRSLSVDERLAWIFGRETTRAEDMSYSLLGLFEVTMPVIYGEGAESARKRLHREIFKMSAPATILQPTHNIPFPRDPDFVSRGNVMDRIGANLARSTRRVALVGLGGVGKSQLAIEYTYHFRETSRDTWVFWVHASNRGRFEQSVRDIADQADIPGRSDEKADIFQLLRNWLRNVAHGHWIVVLDNADDAGFLLDSTAAQSGARPYSMLFECIPVCEHGSLLVTSRSNNEARRLVDDASLITIDPMQEVEAIRLLQKKLGEDVAHSALTQLATALEHMPLAIIQAAAYINRRRPLCTVEQYLDKFRRGEKSGTSLLNVGLEELRRDREAKNSIMLTWQISFEHVYELRRSAADLLSLMSFFDYQGIPASLLQIANANVAAPEQESARLANSKQDSSSETSLDDTLEDDIIILHDFCFISVSSQGSTFEMHRLVQLAMRMWLTSKGQYQRWAELSLRNLDKAFPSSEFEDWTACREIFPHARQALDIKPSGRDASSHWSSVLYKAAWYARDQGYMSEAEMLARSSRDETFRVLGEENEDTLACDAMIALALKDQGKYEAAEEEDRRTLDARERLLGREHQDTLRSVNNLALVLQCQRKYEAAEALNRRALEWNEKVHGREHPETLTSINNLALILQGQGKCEAAEMMVRRALEGRERVLGREHPHTIGSLHNLASVMQRQGKNVAAEEISRRALEGYEKVLGPEHPYTLASIENLALVLTHLGKHEAAEEMGRRALEGKEKALGHEHPHTVLSISNLSFILRYQGKYEAAEEMSVRALRLTEKALGEDHVDTLERVCYLACLHCVQDKYTTATSLYERAYSGFAKTLGTSHPSTVRCLGCLQGLSSLREKEGRNTSMEGSGMQKLQNAFRRLLP